MTLLRYFVLFQIHHLLGNFCANFTDLFLILMQSGHLMKI